MPKDSTLKIKQGGSRLCITQKGSKLSLGIANPCTKVTAKTFYYIHLTEKNAWKLVEFLNRGMA